MIESHAFAMAVFEISAALKDCVGAGPQADIRVMMNKETMVRYFFFIFFLRVLIFTTNVRSFDKCTCNRSIYPIYEIRLANLIFSK